MNDWLEFKELYHHGIKGQKWGVRKYQNTDGSLTKAGKIRYGEPGSSGRQVRITSGNGNIHRRGDALGTGPVGQGGRSVGGGGGGYAEPPEDIQVTVIGDDSDNNKPTVLTNGPIQAHVQQMSAEQYEMVKEKYKQQIANGKKKTQSYFGKTVSALVNGVKKILGAIISLFSPKK